MSRNFAEVDIDLDDETPAPAATKRRPAHLHSRISALTGATSNADLGQLQEISQYKVDPNLCRMWRYHNREYALLTAENCADLIASIKKAGRNTMPAFVRRIDDGGIHSYEVIAGARRHFAVTYLRDVEKLSNIEFHVQPIDGLTDIDAHAIMDLENRNREDISDYERARDYLIAIDAFYDGKQITMAERLELSKSYLSRLLDLARLPDEIVEAFPSILDLKERHARDLKPFLSDPKSKSRLLSEASKLKEHHQIARSAGAEPMDLKDVMARLVTAGRGNKKTPARKPTIIKSDSGTKVLKLTRSAKSAKIDFDLTKGVSRSEAEQAFANLVDELFD
ncbi:MAG: ParB/RepB/Spo0J family partition protein [Pseudomonadota bacterium]